MWHWKTLKTFKKGDMLFNQCERGELPRKSGLNAAYRIIYCSPYLPSHSIPPYGRLGHVDDVSGFSH
jgi:hypothetical protein